MPRTSTKSSALLEQRIRDIVPRTLPRSLESAERQLHGELAAIGVSALRPRLYLSDEWFCPTGTTLIAVPFYLVSRQLMQLQREVMDFVEGGTHIERMRLLRHEAGHCFDHAYQISRLPEFKELFGNPRAPYDPDRYVFRPYSRRYVHNLRGGYAQSHPIEDFAETFAVWLDPQSGWRRRYRGRDAALAKLLFIDRLARRCGRKAFVLKRQYRMGNACLNKETVSMFFARQRTTARCAGPDWLDRRLIALTERNAGVPAAAWMKRREDELVFRATADSDLPRHAVGRLIRHARRRTHLLRRRVPADAEAAILEDLSVLFRRLARRRERTGTCTTANWGRKQRRQLRT